MRGAEQRVELPVRCSNGFPVCRFPGLSSPDLQVEPRRWKAPLIGRPERLPCRIALAIAGGMVAAHGQSGGSYPAKIPLSPPHPEIPPTFWEQHWPWVIAAGIALAGLIVLAVLVLRRKRPVMAEPIEVQTRRELETLLLRDSTDARTLSRITRCLRAYLSDAFGLPPEETTTTELIGAMGAQARLGSELSSRLSAFFRRADELKFAPAQSIGSALVNEALELFECGERRRAELRRAAASPPPVYT